MATDAGAATSAADETASAAVAYSLDRIIVGIADDLEALRAGRISVLDAQARAELAKQFLNGVRLVVNVRKSLAEGARLIGGSDG